MEKKKEIFVVGEIVKVVDFLYFYKEMTWLSIDCIGTVKKILPTNNKYDYQRLEIEFWGILKPYGKIDLFEESDKPRIAKLYSAEVSHIDNDIDCVSDLRILKNVQDDILKGKCVKSMENNYDILNRFRYVSEGNIENKYENLINDVIKNDKIVSKVNEIKKDLENVLKENTVCIDDVCIDIYFKNNKKLELLSQETRDKIDELREKKQNEINELKDFCSNVGAVIGAADSFDSLMTIYVNYGIVSEDFCLNTDFGLIDEYED